jgi:hypothetical protein
MEKVDVWYIQKEFDTSIRILSRATILNVARDVTYVTSLFHQLSLDVRDK